MESDDDLNGGGRASGAMPVHVRTPIVRWANRLSPTQAKLFGYGFLIPLALIDHASNFEVSFSIFYLIPVLIVGWRSSLRAAIIMSLVSATLWEAINQVGIGIPTSLGSRLWNMGTRIAFYVIVSYLLVELRHSHRALSILSGIDSLTGIRNRRAFLESLDFEMAKHRRSGQPLSLAYLDLDNFKQVNDTEGHQAGDEVLRAVAKVLGQTLRETDIIGRLGGDEFAILMSGTKGEGALAALSLAVSNALRAMAERSIGVTFSVGVVTVIGETSAEQLLCEADALMFEVKRAGGNNKLQRDFLGTKPSHAPTHDTRLSA